MSLTVCLEIPSAAKKKKKKERKKEILLAKDFLGGLVVKTSPSNAVNGGSITGQELRSPQTQNITQKQYCNKFNKDFKNKRTNRISSAK